MTDLYARAPKTIDVPFEYENNVKTSYYSLELPDYTIERVDLESIYSFVEEWQDEVEFEKITIAS